MDCMEKSLELLFKANALKCPGDMVPFIFIKLVREILFWMELQLMIHILQYMIPMP